MRTAIGAVERLIEEGDWVAVRGRIERELAGEPNNHWLLTQLGVTYYEQGQYKKALDGLLASHRVLPDCPLTLWNLAGTLDALGRAEIAAAIYIQLIESDSTPTADPCWEGRNWADGLKTDCVYRLGVCFQHMAKMDSAEYCLRRYVELILDGAPGTYSVDAAAKRLRELRPQNGRHAGKNYQSAFRSTLRHVAD